MFLKTPDQDASKPRQVWASVPSWRSLRAQRPTTARTVGSPMQSWDKEDRVKMKESD